MQLLSSNAIRSIIEELRLQPRMGVKRFAFVTVPVGAIGQIPGAWTPRSNRRLRENLNRGGIGGLRKHD